MDGSSVSWKQVPDSSPGTAYFYNQGYLLCLPVQPLLELFEGFGKALAAQAYSHVVVVAAENSGRVDQDAFFFGQLL